ncbi:MAG: hypothetical protein LQ342_000908 [Letrouitia transgressa]|nr:MAG: hypothetical protein LQ342_000908 [Letrouitia transgressa]
MGRPKRNLLATANETINPPVRLEEGLLIARIKKAEGNSLYEVELPSKEALLVELPPKFRSQIWIKRGSFVVVDTAAFTARNNKLDGQIANVVRDEKQWRKQPHWFVTADNQQFLAEIFTRPEEFPKISSFADDSGEESTVGKMPPSDDSK